MSALRNGARAARAEEEKTKMSVSAVEIFEAGAVVAVLVLIFWTGALVVGEMDAEVELVVVVVFVLLGPGTGKLAPRSG